MLLFDALIGLHDRHHGNWGIITSLGSSPRFAPFYDNARALFWNDNDSKMSDYLRDHAMLVAYVNWSLPQMRFENGATKENHFDLIKRIADYNPSYRSIMSEILMRYSQERVKSLLDSEFSQLMSKDRRLAIVACLISRHEKLMKCVL